MGRIIHVECPKCGYHALIFAGGGSRDCMPETALSAARNDPGLETALKAGGRFRIERFPAVCSDCRRVFAAAQVTYWAPDGAEHEVRAACPDCGSPVQRSEGDLPCPTCGHPIEQLPVGNWD